ncbi:hypothetical protein GW17_00044260 [Ensete ventricosum]|nr:hypothetical protein GW17_00044260 [Ensete ventricosum]
MKLQPNYGPRSSLSIKPSSDDTVEPRREFAKRFVEGIGKLAGNTPGDRQKKTIGLVAIMSEVTRLGGNFDGWTAHTLEIRRQLVAAGG